MVKININPAVLKVLKYLHRIFKSGKYINTKLCIICEPSFEHFKLQNIKDRVSTHFFLISCPSTISNNINLTNIKK